MAISFNKLNIDNIKFDEPKNCTYVGGSYHKISIKYIDENGDKIDLCMATNPLTSYGVKEFRKQVKGPVENYSLSLVVDDQETRDGFERIFQKCRDHLAQESVKEALDRYDMSMLDPFYRKNDDGSPSLYPKLLTAYQKVRRGTPEITTEFVDSEDNPIDPKTLVGSHRRMIVAITVKDIYIGENPSIQLKVNDAIVLEELIKQAKPTRKLASLKLN